MNKSFSFTKKVKKEISETRQKHVFCQKAELLAILRDNSRGNIFRTKNPVVARRVYLLFKNIYKQKPQLIIEKSLQNENYCCLEFPNNIVFYLKKELGLGEENRTSEIGQSRFKACCRKAYLRGAFMRSGFLVHPQKGYHLEIIAADKEEELLINFMAQLGLKPKAVKRRDRKVIYLKEADQVADFLGAIGSNRTLFSIEDHRILKQIKNDVNRTVNCETANLNRTVNAGMKQVEAILILEREVGLTALSPALFEIAEARLQNPSGSLKELAQKLGMSKSGVNQRLRRIMKMAEKVKGEEN